MIKAFNFKYIGYSSDMNNLIVNDVQKYKYDILHFLSIVNKTTRMSKSISDKYITMIHLALYFPSSISNKILLSSSDDYFYNQFNELLNDGKLSIIDYNEDTFILYIKIYANIQNYITRFLIQNSYNFIIKKNNIDELLDEIILLSDINKSIYGNEIIDDINKIFVISSTPIMDMIKNKSIDLNILKNDYYSNLEELLVKIYMVYLTLIYTISVFINRNIEYVDKNYITPIIFACELKLELDDKNEELYDYLYPCFISDRSNMSNKPLFDMNIYRIEKFISIYNIYKDKFIKILNNRL